MDISISVTFIAIFLFIITVFLVIFLIKAIRAFTEAQKFIEMIRLQTPPLLHDVTQIMGEVRSTVKSVHKGVDTVGESLVDLQETTRNIREFEAMLQKRVEQPLLEIVAVLSALVKGGKVFWQHFFNR
ncbi:MAG TPA: DUF948 domain-containing protein [Deltaproteobacteria bacterium]|nr:DUF948 domain-containing protein [Deltaproteobacteria bacterium]